MKVLFLSAWYPTKRDAMAGLFVEKHAEAVRQQGHDVRVLYSDKTGIGWARAMYQSYKTLRREWGLPEVVQMNVLDKNGLIAGWLKWRHRIPYIIVEHWSGYLPHNFSFRGGWHSWLMRKIARHASCILPVSQMLENAMKHCGIQNAHWQRVHNVVDDFFYDTENRERNGRKLRLLHVSCFDEKAKNIQGMLRAVRQVAAQRQDFEFIIVGNGADYQADKAYAESLCFPDGMLIFTGEQTPHEVAAWMRKSDCLVMFSRYENAPVVISESLATGIPIISSNAGGIPEMVHADSGILVPSEDEAALAQAIIQLLDNPSAFRKEVIQQYGEPYRFEAVGKELSALYQRVIVSAN